METKNVKITTADPSAIGLFGLALVTLLSSSEKLGWTTGTANIIPWAIFLGGLAQLYAGSLDVKHGNTFGATAFIGFGLFWEGVALTWLIGAGFFGDVLKSAADPHQFGLVFLGYMIFTLFMGIGAMETHKVLFAIFVCIELLFIGLTLTVLCGINVIKFAGVAELGVSILSFYGAAAAVLNPHFGKVFLPVGQPFKIFKK